MLWVSLTRKSNTVNFDGRNSTVCCLERERKFMDVVFMNGMSNKMKILNEKPELLKLHSLARQLLFWMLVGILEKSVLGHEK